MFTFLQYSETSNYYLFFWSNCKHQNTLNVKRSLITDVHSKRNYSDYSLIGTRDYSIVDGTPLTAY